MLRSLMLVLDGIADAEAATRTTLDLAARAGALVDLVGIVDRPRLALGGIGGIGAASYGAAAEASLEHRLVERLDHAIQRCQELAHERGLRCETELLEGKAVDLLHRFMPRADLVVLPNTARQRRDNDSVDVTLAIDTGEVIIQSPRPVILVGGQPLAEGPALIAYDGRVGAARALAQAVALGLLEGREVVIVVIVAVDADAQGARAKGESARRFLARHGVQATLESIVSGDRPADALAAVCGDRHPALFVMGSSPERGFSAWLAGTSTPALLGQLDPPILTCA